MQLIGIGIAIGLAGAVAVTRLLTGLLYGVSPLDPVTWVAASALLAVAGIVATAVPALRATGVDPILAIRQE
jgi:ABC-type antimicrobial peptide transport system permease subunit